MKLIFLYNIQGVPYKGPFTRSLLFLKTDIVPRIPGIVKVKTTVFQFFQSIFNGGWAILDTLFMNCLFNWLIKKKIKLIFRVYLKGAQPAFLTT